MKVSELEGAELDYWAANVVYDSETNPDDWVRIVDGYCLCGFVARPFTPSTDWSQGVPLIEEYGINTRVHCSENGVPTSWEADFNWPMSTTGNGIGSTLLIAAMRALVASKYGDEVSDDNTPPDGSGGSYD